MSTCAKCAQPLEVELSPGSDSEASDIDMDATNQDETVTVPDDVHLPCGCHFHWQCLLDSYDLEVCPNCSKSIVSYPPAAGSSSNATEDGTPQILVDIFNEGGPQRQTDIFPLLKEESYLRAYPEERKSRAFLELCREGDHRAIVDLLKSCSQGEDDVDIDEPSSAVDKTPDEILRYQDPIGDTESGLHACAANGHREVAWLLLLLASNFPELDIPALVYQEAATLGVMREDQDGKVDIRSLRDAHGRTAEDVAKEFGVIWNGWIGNGRLAIP